MYLNQFIIEHQSPFDVPGTVEKLIETAIKKDWQNPATHNLQQSLAKSGKNVKPVQIVEICKPDYSGVMLEKSDERLASVMMPCRISVYEKEDGKTYIALLDMSEMTSGLPGSVAEAMRGASSETIAMVKSVIGNF